MAVWEPTGTQQIPSEFTDQVREVLARLQELATAESMGEHMQAAMHFSEDASWDSSLAIIRGRAALRVAAYRLKYCTSMELVPLMADVDTSDADALTIRYLVNMVYYPKRTWVNPLGFLLPGQVVSMAVLEVILGSRRRISDISLVRARSVNGLALPSPLRALNGWLWAGAALLGEPVWSRMVHLLGDTTYVEQRMASKKDK